MIVHEVERVANLLADRPDLGWLVQLVLGGVGGELRDAFIGTGRPFDRFDDVSGPLLG